MFAHLVAWLSQRWHPSQLIALGGMAAVLAPSLVAISQRPATTVAAAALMGVAWAAMHSTLQTWPTEVMPQDRAMVVSLFAGALFIGSANAAVAVAGPVEAGRYSLVFALGAVLAGPLAVAAGVARWRWAHAAERTSR